MTHKDQFINCVHAVCFPIHQSPKILDPLVLICRLIFFYSKTVCLISQKHCQVCRWFRGEKEIYRLGPPIIKAFDKLLVGNDLPVKLTLRHQIDAEEETMSFPLLKMPT